MTPDGVRAPGRHPGRQHDVRRGARAAPALPRAQPRPGAVPQPDHPLPPAAPRPQPPGPARRAGQRAGGQVRGRGIGVGAQQQASLITAARSRPGGRAARGSSCCRLPGRAPPRTLITRISGNDTMNASKAPGQAVTGTGPCVLTVSSRTEPDTGRLPATGTLTPDDANPPLRAHQETPNIRYPQRPAPGTAGTCRSQSGPHSSRAASSHRSAIAPGNVHHISRGTGISL